MDAKQKRPKPRLDRRNAIKNIDYDASSSSSSLDDQSPNLRTRSLDLSPFADDKTSFRIKGIDGEFDRICRSLGLSGPDDFAIPTAAWEAQKARSSSDVGSRLQINFDSAKPELDPMVNDDISSKFGDTLRLRNEIKQENECSQLKNGLNIPKSGGKHRLGSVIVGPTKDGGGVIKQENDCCKLKSGFNLAKFGNRVRVSGEGKQDGDDYTLSRVGPTREGSSAVKYDNFSKFESRVTVRIKGDRPPPVLAPPPVMLGPVVDDVSSTWDLLRSFAPPQDDEHINSPVQVGRVCSWVEKDRGIEENQRVSGVIVEREAFDGPWLGETDVFSEPGSSMSDDDGNDGGEDTFSVIVEPVYSISPNGKFRRSITSWQKGELLGSGSFGTVYEGFTDDGFFFAVKEVSLLDQGSLGKQSIFQLEQEISLLSQFEHENIVQYLGTDKDETKLYIFLELITKGSLAKLYQKYRLDSQVSAYTRQILNGLKYLHDQNVVHRDIKCANILVDVSGSVKLADFGLAKATKMNDVKSCKGTAFWMAPEVVNQKNRGYGLAADIWSLGCTVLEMLTRRPPYSHLEGMQALFRIGKGEPPPVPTSLSRDARDFILKCIQVNPNDRPTASQLLDHPFVKRPLQTYSGPGSPYYLSIRS